MTQLREWSAGPRRLTRDELREFPLPAYEDVGKLGHGYLLVVAGSRQTPGSATLTASAALRSGVGKVTVVSVQSTAASLSIRVPEAKIVTVAETPDGGFAPEVVERLCEQVEDCGAVVAGPGVEGEMAGEIARTLLGLAVPVVLDAAALYPLRLLEDECSKRECATILLPHEVEMAALLGCSEDEARNDRLDCARQAAKRYNAIVLGKGPVSHVAAPDGCCWTYSGGAAGLGIAGSGDTLAGIVGALVARGADGLTALLWAVLLHGEAGEELSRKIGPAGFLAREIPDEIPALLAR
jgi:ADP-dependent NAD(P)H-hydrate dehydratase